MFTLSVINKKAVQQALGKARPAKSNYLEIRYAPSAKNCITVRLCRKGQFSVGYAAPSVNEAVTGLIATELIESGELR